MGFKQFKKKEPIDPVQALLNAIRGVNWGFIVRNKYAKETDTIDGMIIGNDAFVNCVSKLLPANFEDILEETKEAMKKRDTKPIEAKEEVKVEEVPNEIA